MNTLQKITISGAQVFPVIEGGKGIGISNAETSGAFAAADAVGTISVVFPPSRNEEGKQVPLDIRGKSRKARSEQIIRYSIDNSVREIEKAYEISEGRGRIHINVLWGIAGAETIVREILKKTPGKVHGVTCGAGMPYRLSAIAQEFNVYYYPIISSARAFNALWTRSYKDVPDLLGGVVYEDPWLAGGHNGLSNKDNPMHPEEAIGRIREIRNILEKVGRDDIPVILAGGVWTLKDAEKLLEVYPQKLAFQLGTRPLLVKESPVADTWREKLLSLKKGDVVLNSFSATGFYSSAVKNDFLEELQDRSSRQVSFTESPDEQHAVALSIHKSKAPIYIKDSDRIQIEEWISEGFSKILKTPDDTLLLVSPDKAKVIQQDQKNCKGCLAACRFSAWSVNPETNYSTGKLADPRSYCIQKTLENIVCHGDVENELLFCGHSGYRFAEDPLFQGELPTVKELVDNFVQGN